MKAFEGRRESRRLVAEPRLMPDVRRDLASDH